MTTLEQPTLSALSFSPPSCCALHSVQAATLEAGGLALALAALSLEGEERALYAPPLVAARSAGLLVRLCPLPAALEAMARPGVVDRVIQVNRLFSRLRYEHLVETRGEGPLSDLVKSVVFSARSSGFGFSVDGQSRLKDFSFRQHVVEHARSSQPEHNCDGNGMCRGEKSCTRKLQTHSTLSRRSGWHKMPEDSKRVIGRY